MLLRYMYSYKEINMLDSYLFQLATNKEQITKQFKTKLENIREVPEIPMRQVNDILEGYKIVSYMLN